MTDLAPPHRIALVDDHVLVIDGLAQWIETNAPDFTVVAVSGSWESLVADESFPPEVVLMARVIESPSTLRERIRACTEAGARVVIMSTEGGSEAETDALESGADAFVPKSRPAEVLIDAARRVLGGPGSGKACPDTDEPSGAIEPDDWQRRVLRLYATGQSTVDIALIEGVRFERVRAALKAIRTSYEAQGRRVDTRDELLRRAAEDGYLAEREEAAQ
ncbi:response regulator transcription factor [Agreia pratensis]|uniref:DNA-binding response regulator, NarL/FixJ family, contains REC and HTH domains n=1 Tax=Agreia pratensis TaxID=150121 RepID=A0A1X7IHU7_9MICO|nr:response regulator transcription factor [Agreia pratensis]MBF4633212.1 response regulator transcription factor [Agreia pratensis]SMG13890.1 DNA-binding response regulator, NarL/FixJ family, contains REC and HTH domains [Agreia pratensis]